MKYLISVVIFFMLMVSTNADQITGWRGNWSGSFPDASPPIQWGKVSKLMAGLRCQAEKPEGDKPTGVPMHSGTISEWLILGPVPSEDLQDEGNWQPAAGEKVKGKSWGKIVVKGSDVSVPELFVMIPDGNAVYLHSHIYSPQEGDLLFHHAGGKVRLAGMYVNGAPVALGESFARKRGGGGGSIKLRKGWNRLLCKIVGKPKRKGNPLNNYPWRNAFTFGFRPSKVPNGSEIKNFEMKNIVWATRLPAWGPASPVVVGGDVFVMSDPGDLICLDKKSGKIKWLRSTTFYDVADEKARKENPAFKEIAALVRRLEQFNEELVKSGDLPQEKLKERVGIYKKIIAGMRKIDEGKYYSNIAHTGNVVPTPVSDGKYIYFRLQYGIAACFDLKGNRQWISSATDLKFGLHGYGQSRHGINASVALIGGNLLVPRVGLAAYNAVSGKLVWEINRDGLGMTKFSNINDTPFSLDIGGKEYICIRGRIIDPENGKVLWDKWPEGRPVTPVLSDDALFGIRKGNKFYRVELPGKLSELAPASKELSMAIKPQHKRDSMPNSPVIHEGLAYVTNVGGFLFVIDIKTCALVYSKSLGMGPEWGASIYKGMGNAYCSPVLAGKYIYFFAANGTTVVIEPGRTYKEVARNKIESNETFVSTPVAEGDRLYIRGDKYLYCIGKGSDQ